MANIWIEDGKLTHIETNMIVPGGYDIRNGQQYRERIRGKRKERPPRGLRDATCPQERQSGAPGRCPCTHLVNPQGVGSEAIFLVRCLDPVGGGSG
jgi:hypothetical protein